MPDDHHDHHDHYHYDHHYHDHGGEPTAPCSGMHACMCVAHRSTLIREVSTPHAKDARVCTYAPPFAPAPTRSLPLPFGALFVCVCLSLLMAAGAVAGATLTSRRPRLRNPRPMASLFLPRTYHHPADNDANVDGHQHADDDPHNFADLDTNDDAHLEHNHVADHHTDHVHDHVHDDDDHDDHENDHHDRLPAGSVPETGHGRGQRQVHFPDALQHGELPEDAAAAGRRAVHAGPHVRQAARAVPGGGARGPRLAGVQRL